MPASLLLLAALHAARATPADTADGTTPTRVRVGGFVDVYYAWNAGRPREINRPYTTQPTRHDAPRANLVHVEAVLEGERVRGRVALQTGTAVTANYASPPGDGTGAGREVLRHVQEATLGVRVARALWLDGGIYASPIGLESWVSRDNLTYTRSLIADYTPYFFTGARVSWAPSPRVRAQLHVVTRWLPLPENNGDRALAARVEWTPAAGVLVGASGFRGNEQPRVLPGRTRWLAQAFARMARGPWEASLVVDRGWQAVPGGGRDTWFGAAAIARRALSRTVRVSARVERFSDRREVLIATGTPGGFAAWGGSLGVDVQLERRVLWRTEVRGFGSPTALWPRDGVPLASRTSGVGVTSLAFTF